MSNILLLEAITPISHGDPGGGSIGNASPFRMQSVMFPRPGFIVADDDTELDGIKARRTQEAESAVRELAQEFPLAPDSPLTGALLELSAEEFCASVFLFMIVGELNRLNGGAGVGLFSGMERYTMLLLRTKIVSGSTATSLFQIYGRLLNELKIDDVLSGVNDILPSFFRLPRSVQAGMIKVLHEDTHSIIEGIVRPWLELSRGKGKKLTFLPMFDVPEGESVYYNPAGRVMGTSLNMAEASVPVISGGAFRHSVFRETLFDHLLEIAGLGSVADVTRDSLLPDWVTMLFSNGGNVRGGLSAPSASAQINATIKETFPMIALVSGCVPTHILGEGALRVASHTLCAQTAQFTQAFGYRSDVDAAVLLQTITNTRHVPDGMDKSKDSGQMIFSYTAMKPGTRLLLTYGFEPFTSDLTRGAAYFAVNRWLKEGGHVGGRAAQGCGQVRRIDEVAESETRYEDDNHAMLAGKYEEYIEENRERLRDELVSGRLGWKVKAA